MEEILKISKCKINAKITILYNIGALFYYWSLVRININDIICFKEKDLGCFFSIIEYVLFSSITLLYYIFILYF